jgi:hypothetical protein
VSAPNLHTPQQVADLFGLNRETVLRKCRAGEWPHRRLGPKTIVFTDDDLGELLDASKRGSLAGARQP